MKLYKTNNGIIIHDGDNCFLSTSSEWDSCMEDNIYERLKNEIQSLNPVGDANWLSTQKISAPIGSQEVWAAGVTYLRSKTARMEESHSSGGAIFYDKVYEAERPELFFKASAFRVAGTNEWLRIRHDSDWNVPEPELTLVISSTGKIIGYTIGNDMSSRSIEGENPLYLPQAKVYDRSAGLGPCVLLTAEPIPSSTFIEMEIERNGDLIFEGRISISQMKRSHEELVDYLFRECSFPHGVYLMTGTGLVPGDDFTLRKKDIIRISISEIGTLVNFVS
jgi:2-dehydro-3-deoxy-D-arabinonate dehydratase